MNPDAFSLLAPASAIIAALLSRNVSLSLLLGIVVGSATLFHNPFAALYESIELILAQFQSDWKVKTVLFVLMVGGIMHAIEQSGAFIALIDALEQLHIRSKRAILLSGYSVGLLIFLESSITALVIGALINPLKRKYRISNAKLAYLCDSTASPVCSLFIFNAWGALLLGLVATQIDAGTIQGDALSILSHAIFLNFYAIFALLILFITLYFNVNIFQMKAAEKALFHPDATREPKTQQTQPSELDVVSPDKLSKKGSIWQMIAPISVMLFSVPILLLVTGHGDITKGDGSAAIFYAVFLTLVFILLQYRFIYAQHWKKTADDIKAGMYGMLHIAVILLLAFALGDITVKLETGHYLATIASGVIPAYSVAAVIFLIASIMSFATGTSWGTFSIMMPIAILLSAALDAPIALSVAAVISGGLFGDHASPISDTTIISSMAAECDIIEHVQTQLPYALMSATLALFAFVISGVLLS